MRGKWLVATAAGVTAVVVGAVMLLGSSTAQARDNALTEAHLGESLAALNIIDDLVEHQAAAGAEWFPAVNGVALDDGDGVRTDATGFAEVLYGDGSITRLDALTEFGVVTLANSNLAPDINVRLEVGRTWNNVREVTGERGSFEVQTPVGTAAVRGTIFIIECDRQPVCTFSVIEGVVEVTTLDGLVIRIGAGETVTLGIDGRDDAGPGFGAGGAGTIDGGFSGGGADGGTDGTGGIGANGSGTGATGTGGTGSGAGTTGGGFQGPLGPQESVAMRDRGEPGISALSAGAFAATNLGLDGASADPNDPSANCAVTVGGRNAQLANTPSTAITVPVDQQLAVAAVATGPLDTYQVDLYLANMSFLAGAGAVEPNANGDTTTYRGTADVSTYAKWGAGLYEVRAQTTGTTCDVKAFVNVTGPPPLVSIPSLAAILLLGGGLAGLIAAVTQSLSLLGIAGNTLSNSSMTSSNGGLI